MSKKLAAGADAIVLDVKVGDGAFMKSIDDARILAEQMVDLGRRAGRQVVCLLTDMDQPLGAAVGNALEVREAVSTITGEGPPDFTELVLDASSRLLALSDLGVDTMEGRELALQATTNGTARETYDRWIRAQGGDPDLQSLPMAPVRQEVRAPRSGVIRRLSALPIGIAALELGAGRRTKDDAIDHSVGIVCSAKRGQHVDEGQVLADVHARDEDAAARGAEAVLAAYEISDEPPHGHHDILLDVVA
jgi:pyrimidine-nucleoside phosphorylase